MRSRFPSREVARPAIGAPIPRLKREYRVFTRKFMGVLTAGTVAAFLITPSTAAYAEPSLDAQTQQYVNEITDKLTKFGVAEDVQDRLIKKFLAGQQMDAETGAESVSETTRTENGKTITRHVYADGSVAESSVENPPAGTNGRASARDGGGLSGCRHDVFRDQHTYKNCQIHWGTPSWDVWYYADFGYYQFGSHMGPVRGLVYSGTGTFSNQKAEVIVGTCNSTCDSWAMGTAAQQLTVGGVGVTRSVGAKVMVNNTNKKSGKVASIN